MKRERLTQPSQPNTWTPESRLIAYTRSIDIDAIEQVTQALGGLTCFWQRGQYAAAYAGLGAAYHYAVSGRDRFEAVRQMLTRLFEGHVHDTSAPPEVRPRVFGGFAFDDAVGQDAFWPPFQSAHFVLPRLLITRLAGFHWLTICDVCDGDPGERLAQARATFDAICGRTVGAHPAAPMPSYPPAAPDLYTLIDRAAWREMVTRGIDHIRAGTLRKIVLARALEAALDAPVDVMSALDVLGRQYPTAYRFLFRPPLSDATFFGATPELLARLDEGVFLKSHALAGSAPRGQTPADDDRLAAALLASAKDRHEHALVVDWLRRSLTPLARSLDIPRTPIVLQLKHIQHLYTPVEAVLKTRAHILQVIERLHPTPALGGDPQAESVALIAAIEPVTRGWYGAPVGWLDSDGSGEFAVAIRSAVTLDSRVRLYAGAGIVADSDPDKEWDEVALKFRPLLNALGLGEMPVHHPALSAEP